MLSVWRPFAPLETGRLLLSDEAYGRAFKEGCMPTDVKTRAIVALTKRVNATGRDLDAARLLARCTLKIRAVESRGLWGAVGNPAADVTVHADHETLIEARRTGAVERIRRAVRDALSDTPLHRIQWVEAAAQRPGKVAAPARKAAGRGATARSRSERPAAPARAGQGTAIVPPPPPSGGTPIMPPAAVGRKA